MRQPEKRVDTRFIYKPPHHFEAHYRVRIYEDEDRTTVVVSEEPDNPGMSVTNASEDIATQLVRAFNLDPGRTRWIEHYPEEHFEIRGRQEKRAATYDEILYTWDGRVARDVNWRRIPLEEIEILTGEEPD